MSDNLLPRWARRLAGTFLAAALCLPAALRAQPIPWQTERIEYAASNVPLAEALHELAVQTHVQIDVAPEVSGTVTGRFNLAPDLFLSTLAASYGLSAYYDGAVLHVARESDRRTLALRLNYASPDMLLSQLASTGASDARFAPQVDEETRTVVVSGPPAYVERVGETARALERGARERVRTAVRVVTLDTARAGDRNETIGGQRSTMPGVVTQLRERFAQNRSKPYGVGVTLREYEAPLPIIEADVARNAVLVRDRPEKLDADAQMIRAYDTRPPLVRIVAYVADIDAGALAALPLQWRVMPESAPDAYALPGTPPAPRYAYSDDDGAALAAQLKEFVTEGRARLELERDELTVDGMPLDLDRRAARVLEAANDGVGAAGSDESLLDVADGVTLRVTPAVGGTLDMPHVALTAEFAVGSGQPAAVRVDVASRRAVLIAAAPSGGVPPRGDDASAEGGMPPRTRVVLLIPYANVD